MTSSGASAEPTGGARRRVLLVTQWFDPEPTFKGMLFAKALQQLGYEVRVLTGFPNYPGGKLYSGFRMRPWRRVVIDGIDVCRVALYPSHDSSRIGRVANYLSFAVTGSIAALFVRRPDVAYVYHPPATVGFIASVLRNLRGVPIVYDVQDLWPDTLASTGMIGNQRLLKAVGYFMSRVYQACSRVVVLSPGFRDRLIERGVPAAKIDVIPNWTYETPPLARDEPGEADGDFVVLYAGNVGTAQALDVVIGAAELLRGSRVRIDVIGDGLDRRRLKKLADREKLANLRFLDRKPASEMQRYFDAADALLVHLRDDPLFEITIPSKTQAYLRAGKPILMGVRGNASELLTEAGAGLVFEPESVTGLVEAINRLTSLPRKEREAMGERGAAYYEQRLSLKVGAARFDEVFRQAASDSPRYQLFKRLLDVVGAAFGLVIAAVPMGVTAAVVRVRLGGPVLFTQERPGRFGIPFRMVKFRTMTDKKDAVGNLLPDAARLTKLGRFLRATSLDELPELWNVLRGDMSLVGPRPLLMRYTKYFSERESRRLLVRPGITGWSQVNGRNTASWDERLENDVWYVENRSLRLDAKILRMTIIRVLKSDGVVVDAESIMQNLDDERSSRAGESPHE